MDAFAGSKCYQCISQYSIRVFNLDLTGKLGESGPKLDLGGVNLDHYIPV